MIKKLIVLSNHPPINWEEKMKEGWDVIEYIPHPQISPEMTRQEVSKLAKDYSLKLLSYTQGNVDVYFTIQGEYLFTLLTTLYLLEMGIEISQIIYPTTERVSKEEVLPDGTIKKTQYFKFVQWR